MEANRLSYFEYITFIISLNKNIRCLYVSRSIVNKLAVHRFFVRRIAFCTNRFLLLLAGSFTACRGFPHLSFITFTSPNTYDISFQRNVLLILVNQVAELITL
jgi:hypothetical protein